MRCVRLSCLSRLLTLIFPESSFILYEADLLEEYRLAVFQNVPNSGLSDASSQLDGGYVSFPCQESHRKMSVLSVSHSGGRGHID